MRLRFCTAQRLHTVTYENGDADSAIRVDCTGIKVSRVGSRMRSGNTTIWVPHRGYKPHLRREEGELWRKR